MHAVMRDYSGSGAKKFFDLLEMDLLVHVVDPIDRDEVLPPNDKCNTSQHAHPYRTLPTKPVQIMADPSRDVILEAVHFLVKIGNPRHARLSGMLLIRSTTITPNLWH
jgi:hypothetical protein